MSLTVEELDLQLESPLVEGAETPDGDASPHSFATSS